MTSLILLSRDRAQAAAPQAHAGLAPRAPQGDAITRRRRPRRGWPLRVARHPAPWLVVTALLQVVANRASSGVSTAFEDEGLYIFMGHRVLGGLLQGDPVTEFPGSYFSGAPGLYPILAAAVDSMGGLQAVRDLSLVFVIAAMVGVYGFAAQLFGRLAGVLSAGFFASCGPAMYQSTWATFDAMALAILTLTAWLAIWSARRNALLWAPVVGALLTLAFLTKYAAAAYVPFIIAAAVLHGWPVHRWLAVRRGVFSLVATGAISYSVLMLFGRGLLPGLRSTTADRIVIHPAGTPELLARIADWGGPWLAAIALAAVAVAVLAPRRALLAAVLLGAAVVGPAQQVHIGELTSLGKHLAFGIALGAPVVGHAAAAVVTRRRWYATAPLLAATTAVLVFLGVQGTAVATQLRTGYPDDTRLVEILTTLEAESDGKPVLGEQPSSQRYEMLGTTSPRQWADTYAFSYAGLTGEPAFARAIRDHYFGVIYLSYSTPMAHQVADHLGEAQGPGHYYNLVAIVPRYVRGAKIGDWLVWAPRSTRLTRID